jgi:alpha-L-arabinofuranosidase
MRRRTFLKHCAGAAAGATLAESLPGSGLAQAAAVEQRPGALVLEPKPLFDISPLLYMQFMEPLGVTDPSVEAAWDYERDDWRADFVETTKDLAPGALRFGGLFSRYYKWREGVGPPDKRPWMRNYIWSGKETNRVGTREFVDLCRRVGAEPLYCVNFLSDGEKRYATTREGNRTGDAREAADWVAYANDPDNAERKAHGASQPFNIKLWQLGNETSYGGKTTFSKEQAIRATIEFARAMRERDPSLRLLGWGDSGWAEDLVKQAGEHLEFVAMHMMGQHPLRQDTVLRGLNYQSAPEAAWDELMEMVRERVEKNLLGLEAVLDNCKSKLGIAITEGHLSLTPHNANPLLAEWLTGVYHARVWNVYQRHGTRVKIATAADFNGTRWTTNALIHAVPAGPSYLMPTGAVARLFKRHNGTRAVAVRSQSSDLDLAASRDGDKFFLHVANMNYSKTVEASLLVAGRTVTACRVFEIAPENPRQEVSPLNPDVFKPQEHQLPRAKVFKWRFPARSVSALELDCAPQA